MPQSFVKLLFVGLNVLVHFFLDDGMDVVGDFPVGLMRIKPRSGRNEGLNIFIRGVAKVFGLDVPAGGNGLLVEFH